MKTINDRFFWNAEHQSLLVDWTEELGVSCQQIIGGWSKGLTARDYLFGKEDNLALADTRLDLLAEQVHPAIEAWQNTFPQGVLDSLRGLQSRQLEIMALCASNESALSLLLVNANLLHMWLDYCDVKGLSACQMRRGLRATPADLMAMMGLDNSRLALRMVRVLAADALAVNSRGSLRQLFSRPHILRRLMPAGRLNANLLDALERWPWIAGHPIQVLLSQDYNKALRRSVGRVLEADRAELGMEAIEQLRKCYSYGQVMRVEASWQSRINLHEVLATLDAAPAPRTLAIKNRLPILQIPLAKLASAQGDCLKTRHTLQVSRHH